MPSDRESPSGGWRQVYAEMGVSTGHEPADCPECGDRATTLRVDDERWLCTDHGVFSPAD